MANTAEGPRIETCWLFRAASVSLHSWTCRGSSRNAASEQCQSHSEIAVVLEGVFEYRGARGTALVDPNTAICVNAGEPYQTRHPLGAGDSGICLVPSPETLEELLRADRGDGRCGPAFRSITARLSARSHFLLAVLRNRLEHVREAPPLCLEETLHGLLSSLLLGDGSESQEDRGWRFGRTAVRERLAAVKILLSNRYSEALRLDDVARTVGLSPQQLCRFFKRATGSTLHTYLTRLRLRRALVEVLGGCDDLADLAFAVGFSSHSHFTAAFRREFGWPPSAARSRSAADGVGAFLGSLDGPRCSPLEEPSAQR
jgi:AraC family transcriptional regulator